MQLFKAELRGPDTGAETAAERTAGLRGRRAGRARRAAGQASRDRRARSHAAVTQNAQGKRGSAT